MQLAFETQSSTSSGQVEDLSDTNTSSSPEASLDIDTPISLEDTKTRRTPVKKEASGYRTTWNPWVFSAIMVGLLAPLLIPTLVKHDIKESKPLKVMDPMENQLQEIVELPQINEIRVVKEEPYVIERFYDIPKLDEEEVAKLHDIHGRILKAVIACEKAFHKNFDESQYKLALKNAVDDATEGVFEALSIPDPSYNDVDGEVKAFKDYVWETNIKAGLHAFNEPLIDAAIRSLQQLALFSKKVIPGIADELVEVSNSFKINKSAVLGIQCPPALFIPDLSEDMQKWHSANENNSNEEVRQKVQVLEQYYSELTELLFNASKSMDKLASVYLNSVSYSLTPDAEIFDFLHTTDYYN